MYTVIMDALNGTHVPVADGFAKRADADWWRSEWRSQHECKIDPFRTVERGNVDPSLKVTIVEPVTVPCDGNS